MSGELKLVWSTDWHVADQAPESRTDNYTEACFNKISQIRSLCAATNADLCLIGGDVFHVKISAKVRHALVARLIDVFGSFPCPVYSIVGNHDISHNNLDTLPTKPLGVVFSSGALHRLDDQVFEKNGIRVRIYGKDFDAKVDANEFAHLTKGDEDWFVVAYHGYASPSGLSYPGEVTFKYSDLAQLPVDDWYFGHWHIDQSVQEVGGKHFINIGSLTRGALNIENISRSPKAVLSTFRKASRTHQQVRLKVQPSDRVFDLRRRKRMDREQAEINSFIENLRAETESTPSDRGVDVVNRLKAYKVESAIRSKVVDLLEAAESELRSARG